MTEKNLNVEPDQVLRETWEVKDALSREFQNDIWKLAEYLKGAEAEEKKRRSAMQTGKVFGA